MLGHFVLTSQESREVHAEPMSVVNYGQFRHDPGADEGGYDDEKLEYQKGYLGPEEMSVRQLDDYIHSRIDYGHLA